MTHTGTPRRRSAPGSVLCGLAAALALTAAPALAQSLPTAAENLTPGDLDSEHLFGFTEGSDLGVPGEAELEWETSGRLGRRVARFLTVDSSLALKVPLTHDFRLAPGVTFNAYDIGAPGTPTRTTGGFNGGFLETRLRLLDRRAAAFGLTLNIVPGYGTVDGGSGVPARSFGTEIGLLADREIIPGKLIAAVNVGFALSTTRLTAMDAPVRGSGIEVAGALAYCVRPGLFLGGEARYAGPTTVWRSIGSRARPCISGRPPTRPCHPRPGPRSPGASRSPGGRRASPGRSTCRASTAIRCGCASVQLLIAACGLHRGHGRAPVQREDAGPRAL